MAALTLAKLSFQLETSAQCMLKHFETFSGPFFCLTFSEGSYFVELSYSDAVVSKSTEIENDRGRRRSIKH